MLDWFAINTKPYSERLVFEGLAQRKIEGFLPQWRPPRARDGTRTLAPLFSGYVFAHVDFSSVPISQLQYMPGVRRLLESGGEPTKVPEWAIERIKARLKEIEDGITDSVGQQLRPGDRVQITGGALSGFEAVFDSRLGSNERIRLLINFIREGSSLEVNRQFVVRVNSSGNSFAGTKTDNRRSWKDLFKRK
jgi:transcription antitermination factor NusG